MKRKFHSQTSVKESQIKKPKIVHESGSFINKKERDNKVTDNGKSSQVSTGTGEGSQKAKVTIKHSKTSHHNDKKDKVITNNETVQRKKYKKKFNEELKKKEHFKRKSKKYTKKRQECESNVDKCNKESVNDIDKSVKNSVNGIDIKTFKHPKKQSSKKSMKEPSDKAQEAAKKEQVMLPTSSNEFSSNWKKFCLAKGISSKKKHKDSKVSSSNGKSEEKKSPEIWFDDVDEILLENDSERNTELQPDSKQSSLVKLGSYSGCTKVVAMDCEMVGVGENGSDNMLARVSIVNQYGNCVYDTFVKPVEQVVDYRTHVSGVRKSDLDEGKEFQVAQKEVADILKGRTLVGHALHNDLQVLYLSHPKKNIRDTSRFKPFRQLFSGKNPSLKKLSAKVLHVSVQEGEHSSVQDAQATMRLYTMYKKQWEKDIKLKSHGSKAKRKLGKTKIDMKQSTDLLEDSD